MRSVQTCTFFPDFPNQDYQPSLTLAFTTDTQTPQAVIPVFLVHRLDAPFCNQPRCVCQEQRMQKIMVLASITRGEVTLHDATSFKDASEKREQ